MGPVLCPRARPKPSDRTSLVLSEELREECVGVSVEVPSATHPQRTIEVSLVSTSKCFQSNGNYEMDRLHLPSRKEWRQFEDLRKACNKIEFLLLYGKMTNMALKTATPDAIPGGNGGS